MEGPGAAGGEGEESVSRGRGFRLGGDGASGWEGIRRQGLSACKDEETKTRALSHLPHIPWLVNDRAEMQTQEVWLPFRIICYRVNPEDSIFLNIQLFLLWVFGVPYTCSPKGTPYRHFPLSSSANVLKCLIFNCAC